MISRQISRRKTVRTSVMSSSTISIFRGSIPIRASYRARQVGAGPMAVKEHGRLGYPATKGRAGGKLPAENGAP